MSPKFHWVAHFPLHLERLGTLISCLVHERKHKTIKRYADDIHNISLWPACKPQLEATWAVITELFGSTTASDKDEATETAAVPSLTPS